MATPFEIDTLLVKDLPPSRQKGEYDFQID